MKTVKNKTAEKLTPAIVQDSRTLRVLMLGYMNREALTKTKREGRVTFYSRSRQRLWTKGETSGNFLRVRNIRRDCDRDALLISVVPSGPVCHTGRDTCFSEKNPSDELFLLELERIIEDRKRKGTKSSYTKKLLSAGINRIAQKVGEEAVECILEADKADKNKFMEETADLLYHLLVLLNAKGLRMKDVEKVLSERHGRMP